MKTYFVKSLGCKANSADGQLLEVGLAQKGLAPTQDPEFADIIVVNSCTVTDEASHQSQKFVRDYRRKNPGARIIYTGCAAEVDPVASLKIEGVSAVMGNQDKIRGSELIAEFAASVADASLPHAEPRVLGNVAAYAELASKHPMDREWPLPSSGIHDILKLNEDHATHRTRAFIKIQEGCNSFCTYCIIPYGRGPNRSLTIDQIVSEVKILVESGMKEVILTGTNIGDYGLDWIGKLMIDDLIEAILTQTGLARLRVGSLDPTEISDRMIALMESHKNFCPHFHVSLQHTSSKILKLMKRKYRSDDVVACLTKIGAMKRKPFVGMDLITGFPGETHEDFQESIEMLSKLYWSRLHVFPFSERQGTPATKLGGVVTMSERKARARELQRHSLERLQSLHSAVRSAGEAAVTLSDVLVEGSIRGPDGTSNWVAGYTPHYQRVLIPKTATVLRNQVVDINARNWIVDRASGEIFWMAEAAGSSKGDLQ